MGVDRTSSAAWTPRAAREFLGDWRQNGNAAKARAYLTAALDEIERMETMPRSDRFAIWRMRWFPYRTYEYVAGVGAYGPAHWQWPDVLRRPHRG